MLRAERATTVVCPKKARSGKPEGIVGTRIGHLQGTPYRSQARDPVFRSFLLVVGVAFVGRRVGATPCLCPSGWGTIE